MTVEKQCLCNKGMIKLGIDVDLQINYRRERPTSHFTVQIE